MNNSTIKQGTSMRNQLYSLGNALHIPAARTLQQQFICSNALIWNDCEMRFPNVLASVLLPVAMQKLKIYMQWGTLLRMFGGCLNKDGLLEVTGSNFRSTKVATINQWYNPTYTTILIDRYNTQRSLKYKYRKCGLSDWLAIDTPSHAGTLLRNGGIPHYKKGTINCQQVYYNM